jgi:2-(1,2-epoxy-1,2-dihydrophenyl)acetyl-CoA isomerase
MQDDSRGDVFLTTEGAVATIHFNRPARRNALSFPLLTGFRKLLGEVATSDARVLIVRGEGKDFCVGADIQPDATAALDHTYEELAHIYETGELLHEMRQITIAAVDGGCAGPGLAWAAACDLRFASSTAKFNTAFLGVGLSGDMGGPWTLPRILGAGKARELYFLPGKFDAAEALRIGLVSQAFEDAGFEAAMAGILQRLTDSAPLALGAMKGNFLAAERMTLAEFIPFETERHSACGATEDSREAFRAFVEKRRPQFQG